MRVTDGFVEGKVNEIVGFLFEKTAGGCPLVQNVLGSVEDGEGEGNGDRAIR